MPHHQGWAGRWTGTLPLCRPRRSPLRTKGRAIVPVVLVHGTRTSAAIWQPQLAALAAAGHPAHAVDLPGHGSRTDERFTLAGALATIDAAVVAADVPPLLVGLSLGGYTALAYAARQQHRLAGVLVSGCSTEPAGKPLDAYRRVTSRLAERWRPDGTWHVVADMLRALTGHSVLADLERLALPLWLVNGRRDPLRLEERRLLAAAPTARLHVLARAGHDVNSHVPQAYNAVLLGALAELGRLTPAPRPALVAA